MLSEPTIGILKEQRRRFLMRGLANVRAEFAPLATSFNTGIMVGLENPLETTRDRGIQDLNLSVARSG